MKWLWSHWELKLVSLAVAAALWTYTSGQVRVERQIHVVIQPEQIKGLPASLRVINLPYEFDAVLSVPTSKLDQLRGEVLRPDLLIPQDRRESGKVTFALTSRTLGLDADFRLLRTEPADIRDIQVELSGIESAVLAAEPPLVIGLPAGVTASVQLDRTRVEVRGPRDLIQRAEAANAILRFKPIRADELGPVQGRTHEERLILKPTLGQPEPVTPVIAIVSLQSSRIAEIRIKTRCAVLLPLADAGHWRISGAPSDIEVKCSGPEAAIHALTPADISAWIDLRTTALTAGPGAYLVTVQAPSGITVTPSDTQTQFGPNFGLNLVLTPSP
ncbi:MAG: hypothetical protein AAB263_14760 [Planctomycetota bacterium]